MQQKIEKTILSFIMRKYLLFLLALAFYSPLQSQPAGEKYFTVEELKEDMDSLRLWLKLTHPKLYFHSDSVRTEKKWNDARRKLIAPMKKAGFEKLLSPLLAQYNDGHTFIDIGFDSPEFQDFSKNKGKLFPFETMVVDRQLVVKKSWGEGKLEAGVIIDQINNRKTSEIVKELTSSIPGDYAENVNASVSRLFPFLLWKNYSWKDSFDIVYRNADGKQQSLRINGITTDRWFAMNFPRPNWTLQLYPQQKLAVIECTSYQGSTARVQQVLDSFFTIIKENKVEHLAFDLRRNGGGNSYLGNIFLSYLTQKPFAAVVSKSLRDSRVLNQLPGDHWLKKDLERARTNWKQQGEYLVNDFAPDPVPGLRDTSLAFKGKFYLLTSARTYSSAHMTALQVKCYRIGTIIGQPTGEDLDLTGEIIELRLPNTQVVAVCPTAEYKAACHNNNKLGVQPDHFVPLSIENIRRGEDAELKCLFDVIEKRR